MWLAARFCLVLYFALLPLGMSVRLCSCDTNSGTYGAFLIVMPERTGPGQSGAAAGQSYFDDSMPGAMPYPTDSVPQGSRSTFDSELPVEPLVSDDALHELVIRLLGDAARGIDVRVHAGAVTLTGAIDGDDAKRALDDDVRSVPGVVAVDNQLEPRR